MKKKVWIAGGSLLWALASVSLGNPFAVVGVVGVLVAVTAFILVCVGRFPVAQRWLARAAIVVATASNDPLGVALAAEVLTEPGS